MIRPMMNTGMPIMKSGLAPSATPSTISANPTKESRQAAEEVDDPATRRNGNVRIAQTVPSTTSSIRPQPSTSRRW